MLNNILIHYSIVKSTRVSAGKLIIKHTTLRLDYNTFTRLCGIVQRIAAFFVIYIVLQNPLMFNCWIFLSNQSFCWWKMLFYSTTLIVKIAHNCVEFRHLTINVFMRLLRGWRRETMLAIMFALSNFRTVTPRWEMFHDTLKFFSKLFFCFINFSFSLVVLPLSIV